MRKLCSNKKLAQFRLINFIIDLMNFRIFIEAFYLKFLKLKKIIEIN